MEYSSEKVMTRKEYLKSKKKPKFGIRVIKYMLLLVVIVLLGTYLFKQLDIYNNVTKMANKVMEETALARTMIMYYSAEGYTKESNNVVTLYKSSDASRTKLEGTEGFSNIKLVDGKLYGTTEQGLCFVDIETLEKENIIDKPIKEYIIKDNKIYFYMESKTSKETGVYVYNMESKETKQLINITAYQLLIDDNYIYVVSKGKTEKSIIKYNLNGSGRIVLSNKEIVTHISQDKANIYFISSNKLYKMNKYGIDVTCILEDTIYVDSDIKADYSAENIFCIKDKVVYYINKTEEGNVLNAYYMETGEKQTISKKNVESIHMVGNILYYKVNDDLEIYKVNVETGKSEKVTSIRGTEYICVN